MDKILPNLEELLQLCLSLTRDGRAAAALLGEAMAEAYSSWNGSMRNKQCRMWLHKIVTRRYFAGNRPPACPYLPVLGEHIEEERGESNRFTTAMTGLARQNSSPNGTSTEDAMYFEAIASLPTGMRSAMILSCFERLSQGDIAGLDAIEPHGIDWWLDKGRTLLGAELFPHLMDSSGFDRASRGEMGSV